MAIVPIDVGGGVVVAIEAKKRDSWQKKVRWVELVVPEFEEVAEN
jgi:hypothetical protein